VRRSADTDIEFKRPNGTVGKAVLAECEGWVATRTDWGDLGYGRGRLVTEDIEIHHGDVQPSLYLTPKGEYFRPLRWDEVRRTGRGEFPRVYVFVSQEEGERTLRFWGYDPSPSIKRPGPTPSGTATPAGDTARPPAPNPGCLALAAAYELLKEGRPVSLKAACERAHVDRKNVRLRYPDETRMIRALAAPDRAVRRGTRDRRTGTIDAVDEADE
jgi:hypothetical protein